MKKVGVIGYNVNTGIGCIIQDYKNNLPIDSHYVIQQPNIGIDMKKIDGKCVIQGNVNIDDWLDTIDCLITIESPFIDDLFLKCKKRNIRVIVSVDIDWFTPELLWWKDVDVFVCPNMYTKNQLETYGYKNTVYIPASVDTEYFKFQPRKKVETFLFNNGWGGVNARKGSSQVIQVMYGTNLSIIINSQASISVDGPKIKLRVTNYDKRISLYEDGDLYLAPSKWEGHGIHILEAMACGLPVITTNSPPMNEYVDKKEYLIRVKRVEHIKNWRLYTTSCIIDSDNFRDKVLHFYGEDVEKDSYYCRERVEKYYSYGANRDKFLKVIDGE